MRKIVLSTVVAALAKPTLAADMKVKAIAPPPPPPSPWDVAFGAGLTSDYIFRGITQSNHNPSVFAYFELQREPVPPALRRCRGREHLVPEPGGGEIDGYFGIRPTFGPLALYWYPGGTEILSPSANSLEHGHV